MRLWERRMFIRGSKVVMAVAESEIKRWMKREVRKVKSCKVEE